MERPIFYALLSMAFAGVTAVIAKLGMQRISGDAALVVRTSLIFVLVWVNAFALRHTRELELLTRRDLLFLLLSGLTTFLSWLFYYRAVKEGNVSLVATIDKGSVVVAIALSVWLLKEPLTPKLAVGAGLV
ncbi:MAG: EamA family transporter, partial [Flavobacteriales bacterium]|nr:EamA family transporter [Flavobacteriales bacterium]